MSALRWKTALLVASAFMFVSSIWMLLPRVHLGLPPHTWHRSNLTTLTGDVSTEGPASLSAWPYKPVFLLNEAASCSSSSPFFLLYVHTAPANGERRAFLRQTWAHPYFRRLYNFTVVFILGRPDQTTIQREVDNESQSFHDIVQGDFGDSYRNLTFKETAALWWASTFCPQATFVVKADDDLIIKPWLLADTLRKRQKESSQALLVCKRCVNDPVHRDEGSKWYVPRSVYPQATFPPFCAGPMRIMTRSAVSLLAQATQHVPFISLEDVFATGFVAEKAGVARLHQPHLLVEANPRYGLPTPDFVAAHAHTLEYQRKIWAQVSAEHAPSR